MRESQVFERVRQSGVVAVLVIDRAEDAVPLAEALLAGGVDVMELTLRTPVALAAVEAVRKQVPAMLAGVGTILTPEQVRQVVDVGGAFGVAPGMNPRVVEEAFRLGLPFGPGICTPSDIERALEFDCRTLKFFPAEPSGGLAYLQSIAAPYAHLGVKYVPLGGVSEANMGSYLKDASIAAVGGSWIATRSAIQAQDWAGISATARRAITVRDAVRAGKGSA
ncbi:MAG: bifunctional 4-hydroxy-2-oxoglutarate aldolase/2-dehydro-3-deoxy-phosphogluconate aldolase [Gemmataceae bacterium]